MNDPEMENERRIDKQQLAVLSLFTELQLQTKTFAQKNYRKWWINTKENYFYGDQMQTEIFKTQVFCLFIFMLTS